MEAEGVWIHSDTPILRVRSVSAGRIAFHMPPIEPRLTVSKGMHAMLQTRCNVCGCKVPDSARYRDNFSVFGDCEKYCWGDSSRPLSQKPLLTVRNGAAWPNSGARLPAEDLRQTRGDGKDISLGTPIAEVLYVGLHQTSLARILEMPSPVCVSTEEHVEAKSNVLRHIISRRSNPRASEFEGHSCLLIIIKLISETEELPTRPAKVLQLCSELKFLDSWPLRIRSYDRGTWKGDRRRPSDRFPGMTLTKAGRDAFPHGLGFKFRKTVPRRPLRLVNLTRQSTAVPNNPCLPYPPSTTARAS